MDSKEALNGVTIAVLMAVLGIIVLAGTILLMMWAQPGMAKSPSEQSSLSVPSATGLPSGFQSLVRIVRADNPFRSVA